MERNINGKNKLKLIKLLLTQNMELASEDLFELRIDAFSEEVDFRASAEFKLMRRAQADVPSHTVVMSLESGHTLLHP